MAERSPIARSERVQRGLAALAVLGVGLAVVVVYRGELAAWIAGHRGATASEREQVAFYTCSMDPSVEADHPGACPICGMALTPVTKEDRASGVVRIAAAARARLGVVVAQVATRPLIKRVVASGEVVAPPPAATAPRTPSAGGGDPDGSAGGAKALPRGIARASIAVRVYRGDAREVRPGQPVNVSVSELPLTQFVGTVEPPRPTDPPGELRLGVDDPGHAMHPGMRVLAQLEVPLSPRLVVPIEAVVYAGPRRIVFVEHGAGRYEPRTPKLGITAAGLVEVLDGLAAGEPVVVKGTFLLAAESRLRSDGSLWGDRLEAARGKPIAPGRGKPIGPAPGKPMAPAPTSATPAQSGRP